MASSLTLAIGGGKGGVGKSLIASNLAVAFSRLGYDTMLVDADLGAANLHTLFGIEQPRKTLQAFIDGSTERLADVVIPTGTPRLRLLPGSGARLDAADLGYERRVGFLRELLSLEADVVILDCGAGTGSQVVELFDASDLRLVVATPQLTSLQNAYTFLKAAVYSALRQACIDQGEEDVLQGSTFGTATERIRDVLARIATDEAALAASLREHLQAFGAIIVGNQLEHTGQRRAFDGLSRMFLDFLELRVPVHATLPRSKALHRSVSLRRPYMLESSGSPIAATFYDLAEKLGSMDVAALRQARRRQGGNGNRGPLANQLRAYERVAVSASCTIHRGIDNWRATIVDASTSGLGIEGDIPLRPGETISVQVDELRVDALVARRSARSIGLHFRDEKLAAPLVDRVKPPAPVAQAM